MNIYNLHSNPKSLSHHDKAQEIVPKLFWEKYSDNPKELKKREKYIAKDAEYSYLYAQKLKIWTLGRELFTAGEEAISKNAEYAYYYASYVLKKPFPVGEEAISKSPNYSCYYAKYILKGPFPAGEKAISTKESFTREYLKLLSDKEKEEFKKKYF